MNNVNLDRKYDIDLFIKEMCIMYYSKFKENILNNDMFHFCIKDFSYFKNINKKRFFEEYYNKLSSKICNKYDEELSFDDLSYLYESFLLPFDDMEYYNNEIEKPYVDLNSLMNYLISIYNTDYDILVDRLHEVSEIKSNYEKNHNLKLKK